MKIEELLRESFDNLIVRLLLVEDDYYVGQIYSLNRGYYQHDDLNYFIDRLLSLHQNEIVQKILMIYELDARDCKRSYGFDSVMHAVRMNIPTL